MTCTQIVLDKHTFAMSIYICSDSQAVLKNLQAAVALSHLAKEFIQTLKELVVDKKSILEDTRL